MVRGGRIGKLIVQCSAVIVTFWFSSHLFYVVDQSYRKTLKTFWTVKYGAPVYDVVLDAIARVPNFDWIVLLQPTSPSANCRDFTNCN